MARRKGKSISFDAMVKFFMQHYNIPTKKDIDRLTTKIDHLEKLIKASTGPTRRSKTTGKQAAGGKRAGRASSPTAIETVYRVIKRSRKGLGCAAIQEKTSFGEKKIRNIIFRLYKEGKLNRKARGIYTAL